MRRKERRFRAEQKKETIRKEIFGIMRKCSEEGTEEESHIIVNRALAIMIKQNPQEAHLVRSACADIIENPRAFCERYLNEKA